MRSLTVCLKATTTLDTGLGCVAVVTQGRTLTFLFIKPVTLEFFFQVFGETEFLDYQQALIELADVYV